MQGIPDELKDVADAYNEKIKKIDEQIRLEKEQQKQSLKDIQNPSKISLDNSTSGEEKEEKEKEETVMFQLRTSLKNLDGIREREYITKKNDKESEDPVYYKAQDLTALTLDYSGLFPKGINIQMFNSLRRVYPQVEDWIGYDIFKRLDLSNGDRNKVYYGRMTVEQAGQMSGLKEQYFFDPYGDTLMVACTLLAIDSDDDLSLLRTRFEKDIKTVKNHFELLEKSYNENLIDIFNGIIEGRCGTYHIHIFIDFIHNLICGDEESHIDHRVNHREKLLEVVQYFSVVQSKISDKSKNQVACIINTLSK